MSSAGAMPAPGSSTTRKGGRHLRAWMDHAGWIVAAGVIGATIAAMIGISRPNLYDAHTLVQIYQKGDGSGTTQHTEPFDVGMLRSRAVVGPVVERLRLYISVEPLRAPLLGGVAAHFAQAGKLRGPWPERLGYAWGGERVDIRTLDVPERLLNVPMTLEVLPGDAYRLTLDGELVTDGKIGSRVEENGVSILVSRIDARAGTRFTVTRHDTAQTIDTVARELRIGSDGSDTSTVRIAWQSSDRTAVAALINGIADSYITGQAETRRDEAASTLAFLSGELPRVKDELERAEAALTRYRSRTGSMQPSQDAQSYLNSSIDYQKQIAQLKLDRTKLLQRFTEESNEVRTMDSQIQQLTRDRKELDTRMQTLSVSERESVALTRDVKVAEDMYMSLRNRLEQLSLAKLDSTRQTRVVDIALTPVSPIGVGTAPLTMGGGLLGICLAMCVVSVRQRMKPAVATANDAEETLGLAMLGDVAYSREQVELERLLTAKDQDIGTMLALQAPEPGRQVAQALPHGAGDVEPGHWGLHDQYLLARNAPHSMAVEGLRSVRAALHFLRREGSNKVVAVTSPTAGAGKTFVSVNLAVLFAEAGQRVLLVDADLRRGRVSSWFGQPAGPGMAEVLAGRATLVDAARPTVVNGLSILPAGAPPTNPSELLMRPAFADCLRAGAERFDLVLIDTPPVLAVADAMLVANVVGATLLVLRADSTLPSQVEETIKRLTRAGASLSGGILNGVMPKRSNRVGFGTMNPYLGMPTVMPAVRQIAHVPVVEDKTTTS
ncbi:MULTISPECIES: polysaccharide biosynthesis tyrosine autokinase [Cupriavidus]|nr:MULTISPECIES: polysaccharide biosynthesis tyrosine autokinase [Cupriavidus]KWR71524.1 tyrosine protein kinase [Cupriavidus sp. SHE]